MFLNVDKKGIVTCDFSVCWVMSQSRESQPEPDPHRAKRRDLMNTLGLFKSNQYPCEPEPQVKRVSLSKRSSNVLPAECEEDEIFRHTTPLFLLRSKSPFGPSGVNKGRCSKWYANWKEGGKKKKLHKSTRQPRISDTSHLKRKFQYWGWNSEWGLALLREAMCSGCCTQTAQSPPNYGRLARATTRGESRSFQRDLSVDLAETIDRVVENGKTFPNQVNT